MSEALSQAVHYEAIVPGTKSSHDYTITPAVYENFLAAFGDYSPIHVNEDYAKTRGFSGKLMHGSILNGFISHFVGMHFPGRWSVLLSVDLRFSNPTYLGEMIRLAATVSQKMDASRVIVLDILLTNLTRGVPAARGRVQVMVKENA